jgi:hypothetical protein
LERQQNKPPHARHQHKHTSTLGHPVFTKGLSGAWSATQQVQGRAQIANCKGGQSHAHTYRRINSHNLQATLTATPA